MSEIREDLAPPVSISVRKALTDCPQTPAKVEAPLENISPAQWAYMRLAQAITAFEQKLDGEHEVGFHLVQFGDGQVFHAENLGFWAPDWVIFFGRNGLGDPIQLMQHVTQLNVLLVASKKREAGGTARRIGFDIMQDAEKTIEEFAAQKRARQENAL